MAELRQVHGSDNTFFLLDQTTLGAPLPQTTLIQLAQRLCDRTTGLNGGADGLLVVDAAAQAVGKMTVINADGTLAKMCGNGIRTVTRYLSEKTGQSRFIIQTDQAPLEVHVDRVLAPGVKTYGAEISPVSFAAAALPFAALDHEQIIDTVLPQIHPTFKFTAVAVPNPHLIAFVPEAALTGPELEAIGKRLNAPNPYFPEGVNVTFATIEGPDTLFARTYERGVGFTNACGTGMSATSIAFVLAHPEMAALDRLITVYNPGGMVQTIVHRVDARYWVELIGNATTIALIAIPDQALAAGDFAGAQVALTGEAEQYEAFGRTLPYRDLVPTI
ncbi:diaminopimelate epimerase [Lacticaseibacillus absianus]|uniref:diaminopimelate epimerase n=1 Tax=Lacticaseibacillus absianus TaxID=2729623 RepID=UPI0015CE3222|nr:diaminopimelate epimerase [Lacticaseibacillus absianus]